METETDQRYYRTAKMFNIQKALVLIFECSTCKKFSTCSNSLSVIHSIQFVYINNKTTLLQNTFTEYLHTHHLKFYSKLQTRYIHHLNKYNCGMMCILHKCIEKLVNNVCNTSQIFCSLLIQVHPSLLR